ncbi:MAG: hypothetical protein VXZ59_07920 [Cyanobacteriota bacterium]|nr:hypothetical protein [Cyanobacteriota bacterium]
MAMLIAVFLPFLPRASLEDLLVVLLLFGLIASPFVIHAQLRRSRVRRFMARVRAREDPS